MEVSEVFTQLANHIIKGMMIHSDLADYYDFLGLKGYKRCHEYHFMHETCMYRKLNRYYINHYNKLIPEISPNTDIGVIPANWYRYSRQDVDNNTKRNSVRNAMNMWIQWEKETKDLYQKMYKELMDIGEVASANFLACYIDDVDCELKKAERFQLNKQATDYSLNDIIFEQHEKHEKYKDKIKYVGEYLC